MSALDSSGQTRRTQSETVEPREIVNGLMYVLSTRCQWRYVPKDLPPKSTLFGYFDLWNWDGTLDRIHHVLEVPGSHGSRSEPDGLYHRQPRREERGGAASIQAAMMPAKRSRARSAISSSIR